MDSAIVPITAAESIPDTVSVRYPLILESQEGYYRHTAGEWLARLNGAFQELLLNSLLILALACFTGIRFTIGFLFLIPAVLIGRAILRSASIKVGVTGIRFPVWFACRLGFNLEREWDEVKCISVRRGAVLPDRVEGHVLRLQFEDGRAVRLELNRFKREELRALINLCRTYCTSPVMVKELDGALLRVDSERENKERYIGDSLGFAASGQRSLIAATAHKEGDFIVDDLKIMRVVRAERDFAIFDTIDASGGKLLVHEFELGRLTPEQSEKFALSTGQAYAALEECTIPGLCRVVKTQKINDCFYLFSRAEGSFRLESLMSLLPARARRQLLRKLILSLAKTAELCQEQFGSQLSMVLDIAPADVMVTARGETMLLAAGVVRSALRAVRDDLRFPEFLAPEQLRGESDSGSIVYNLGCMALYLYEGRVPDLADAGALSEIQDAALAAILESMLQEKVENRADIKSVVAMFGGKPE